MADVESMFQQVKVVPEDRDVLRFLWWPNGDMNQQPEVYRMNTHLLGGTWSPSCATYALQQAAKNFGGTLEEVKRTIMRNFYVF